MLANQLGSICVEESVFLHFLSHPSASQPLYFLVGSVFAWMLACPALAQQLVLVQGVGVYKKKKQQDHLAQKKRGIGVVSAGGEAKLSVVSM